MPRFIVIEAQEEIRTQMWSYEVEAANEEEALEKVKRGDAESGPTDDGEAGDSDYGVSGWAVAELNKAGNRDLHSEACDDMPNNV